MPGGAGRSIPQRWEMRLGDQEVGRNEVKSQDFQYPSNGKYFQIYYICVQHFIERSWPRELLNQSLAELLGSKRECSMY
jgi:hypothetical protein